MQHNSASKKNPVAERQGPPFLLFTPLWWECLYYLYKKLHISPSTGVTCGAYSRVVLSCLFHFFCPGVRFLLLGLKSTGLKAPWRRIILGLVKGVVPNITVGILKPESPWHWQDIPMDGSKGTCVYLCTYMRTWPFKTCSPIKTGKE